MGSGFESYSYTESFGGKILHYVGFFHQKLKYMLDFWLDSVQKRRIFFLFGNPT